MVYRACGLAIALVLALPAAADSLADTIRRAGSVVADEKRLELLTSLRDATELNPAAAADLEKVVGEIARWISDPRLDYFDRPFRKDELYTFGIQNDSPFRPIEQLYQARMFLWVTLEYGGYWSEASVRRARLDESRTMFEALTKHFPDSPLIAMYLGTPYPPERTLSTVTHAPAWAVHQREAIERLADIITWWIDHRQRDDGQFGGGWGDDCEMWRWWVPVLIGFDDPAIAAAQERLSRGLFAQEHMRGGYTRHVHDVEHTAEDSADTITPMMHLDPGNSEWQQRALRLAELMGTLWTGRNDRGQLQFKSTYFSVDTVDLEPRKACDTVYHPRAVQPALIYWQRTGDKNLGALFTAWMDTWVDATAREERGKPVGIIPSAVHWPDGAVGGLGERWWDPENHTADPLYVWPSAMGSMTDTMLLAFHMTGDDTYLAPIRSMAALRLAYLESPPATEPEPGSAMWCAARMRGLGDTLAKYRLLTGSTEFDPLLQRENAQYLSFRLHGDLDGLTEALGKTAGALRINYPGYTSEVRYTDRVLRFPSLFQHNGMYPEPVAGIAVPDTNLLYATATGDPGGAGYFPMNAVRWLTPPRDIAALVSQSGQAHFEARLFHFGDSPRPMAAEFYLLKPGEYRLQLTTMDRSETFAEFPVHVQSSTTRVAFELPARTECALHIIPAGA